MIGYENARRWAELVQRVYGQDELVPPGLILENDPPDFRLLKGVRMWSSGQVTIAAGGAGTNTKVMIAPIPGIVTVVVGAAVIAKATAGVVRLTIDSVVGTTPAPCRALDTRLPLNTAISEISVATQNRFSNAGLHSGFLIDRFSVALGGDAQSRVLAQQPVILVAGTTGFHNLSMQNETVNEALNALFWGYERVIDADELNFG